MSKIGLLTPDEEKFYGKLLADEIPVTGIMKWAVQLGAPMFLKTIDNEWGDKIPEPWQTDLEKLTTLVYASLQDNVISVAEETIILEHCSVVMNRDIDIPVLEEEDELVIFLNFWKFMASVLRKAVKDKV